MLVTRASWMCSSGSTREHPAPVTSVTANRGEVDKTKGRGAGMSNTKVEAMGAEAE